MTRVRQTDKSYLAAAQKRYAANRPKNLVPPATYGNATTKDIYTGNVMQSPRADADDHFNHASLGLGKQITKAV